MQYTEPHCEKTRQTGTECELSRTEQIIERNSILMIPFFVYLFETVCVFVWECVCFQNHWNSLKFAFHYHPHLRFGSLFKPSATRPDRNRIGFRSIGLPKLRLLPVKRSLFLNSLSVLCSFESSSFSTAVFYSVLPSEKLPSWTFERLDTSEGRTSERPMAIQPTDAPNALKSNSDKMNRLWTWQLPNELQALLISTNKLFNLLNLDIL